MQSTVPVTWSPVSESLPDSDTTVMIFVPADSEPVWLGFHDGTHWRSIDNMRLRHRVHSWAHLPEPPTQSL
jgi:hypothetical protein